MKVKFFCFVFFWGGRSGLILGILLKKQNMGSNEVKSIEMDYMIPKNPDNMYHTYCFMNT